MFEKIKVHINQKSYYLIKDYKEKEPYRASLNALTQKTYGFDFEEWYQQGFWQEKYIPYSILNEDQVIANVSVNTMDLLINGHTAKALQIGTVMTEESHRHQGFSRFLIDAILKDYESASDFIYLFANDSVLDFYPKFGFQKAPEYSSKKHVKKSADRTFDYRKLDMDDKTDKNLLLDFLKHPFPCYKINMINNPGLILFYCISFLKDNIYYIKDLEAIVIAGFNGDVLTINEVISRNAVDLDSIIYTLMTYDEMTVELGFSPLEDDTYENEPLAGNGTTLFVRGAYGETARFPELSHA